MSLSLPRPLLLLLPLALAPLAATIAHASTKTCCTLTITLAQPEKGGTWRTVVVLDTPSGRIACKGLLQPNVYYLQTRSISESLVVVPLYYVLDTVCPKALEKLENQAKGVLVVQLKAPKGYVVRSCMDWRGLGGPGGPYTVPVSLFTRYYIFDSLVVADKESYMVLDYSQENMTLVTPRGTPMHLVHQAARALATVRRAVHSWLGASPREPVVAVIAPPGEHPLLPSGVAHSTGSVVYAKLDRPIDTAWLIHTLAHEAVHGWINYGMLYGDFSFQEAAAEFMALRALHEKAPNLYQLATSYLQEMALSSEQYTVWMRVHAALWYAGLIACEEDVYTRVLRSLYQHALEEGEGLHLTLLDLAKAMTQNAPEHCRDKLSQLIGAVLQAASTPQHTWPLVDTHPLEEAAKANTSQGTRGATAEAPPPARSSPTTTITSTPTSSLVAGVEKRAGPAMASQHDKGTGWWGFAYLAVGFVAGAYFMYVLVPYADRRIASALHKTMRTQTVTIHINSKS